MLDAVAPSSPRRYRVLVAEDNIINQKLLTRLLERAGHEVRLAGNGREALAAFEGERFDLVLMDLQMPEMDGLEAAERIRERERQTGGRVPIVAVTTSSSDDDRRRCLDAGMDDLVPKPVEPPRLFQTIAAVLGTSTP